MQQTGSPIPADAAGDQAIGDMAAPAPPTDHYADRTFRASAMAASRAEFQRENGGQTFSQIMLNLGELQLGSGHPAYRWGGEGWFGSDINRFVVKSEGIGSSSVEDADVEALYSRAISPYFDVQAGVRRTFGSPPSQTYASLGFEGLAPYWLELEGAFFLSTCGDLLGRLEGYYDERITQRLVLQPRVELNFAAQDVSEDLIGTGLSEAEFGLRFRYEIRREIGPYIGVSWDRKVGRTADFLRDTGKSPSATIFVLGVKCWF